jgi:putative phage-type endonuclease
MTDWSVLFDLDLPDGIEALDMRDMSREEWLAIRRTGIGGSDLGAIVGANRFKSAYEVWLEKTGRVPDRDLSDSDAVFFGQADEASVTERFAYRTGYRIANPRALFRDTKRPWLLASPDRLMWDDNERPGVLEVKTAGHFAADDWTDGQVPESYELQTVHYAGLLGLDYGVLACRIGGQKMVMPPPRIEVDAEYVEFCQKVATDFWHDHVLADEPPPPDSSEACADVLSKLWKAEPDEQADVGEEGLEWAKAYRLAHREIKRYEEMKKLAGNHLRALLGPKTIAISGGRKVATWKESSPSKFDQESFERDHPDLAAKYRITTTRRTLLVPASVEKET